MRFFKLLGIPLPFLIAFALCVGFYFLLERTPFGRHASAVGGNPGAAREAGLNATGIGLIVFAVSGLSAAFAGLLLVAQLGTVDATPIQGLELQAIAIAVLGGTTIAGGIGNLPGTFIASLLLAMISSALNLRNIPGYYQYLFNVASYWQYVVSGVVLAAALVVASRREATGVRGSK